MTRYDHPLCVRAHQTAKARADVDRERQSLPLAEVVGFVSEPAHPRPPRPPPPPTRIDVLVSTWQVSIEPEPHDLRAREALYASR